MELEPKTEPNVQQAVPFFAVSNIAASVHYYVDGLGFEMTKKWIDEGKLRWCWHPARVAQCNTLSYTVAGGG